MKYNPRPFERLLDKFIARQAARITGLMDSIYSQIAFHAFRFVGGKDDDFRFSKYPVLSKIVDGLLGKMFSSITSEVVSGIEWSWDLANSKNDDLIATLAKQLGLGVTDALFERWNAKNMAALEAYVKRREKGINLSQKVWNFGGRNKTELELALGLGLGEGKSAAELSRDVRQYLRFPDKLFRRVRDKDTGILKLSRNAAAFHPGQGVYRSSYKNALRLAATENNIAYRRSDYNRVSRMDFVLGIEVHLSANHTIIGPKGNPIEFYDICDELQGIYPKDFVFEGWHPQCYDEESEVYTDSGWKKFADVQDSDLILTLNPDTLDLEYSGYKMKFKSWYDGDMMHFYNRSYDQLVTPEHEVLCLDKNSKEPVFTRVKAEKCGKSRPVYRSSRWVGEHINSIQIGDQNVDFARFCEFMGYWLADGSLGHKWEVQIAQQDEHKKAIYDCIEAIGMNPRYNCGKVEFNNRDWYQYLLQFGKCADKFVPAQIKSSTPEQIQVFLDSFISCDGHIKRPRPFVGNHGNVCQPKEGERNYFTTSKRLADDLGELILKIGRRPAYRLQRSKGKVQHFSNGDYTINYDAWVISECRSVTATQYNKETLPYAGWVYDLVLEKNATMYIRRNGKCFWGSNCRCYTTTILPSREEFFKYLDGMDENGNSTYQFKDAVPEGKVPPQLQEWINNNKYRIERANTLPYFIEHNKKYFGEVSNIGGLNPSASSGTSKKGVQNYNANKQGRNDDKEAYVQYNKDESQGRVELSPLQQENIEQVADAFGLKVSPMTFFEADQGRADIDYKPDSPTSTNCQASVVVQEVRRRGVNLTALPFSEDENTIINQLSKNTGLAWRTKKGEHPQVPSKKELSPDDYIKWVEKQTGPTGRYLIGFDFPGGSSKDEGHIVSAERMENGSLIISETQTGGFTNLQSMFQIAKSVEVLRIDRLSIDIDVLKAIARVL